MAKMYLLTFKVKQRLRNYMRALSARHRKSLLEGLAQSRPIIVLGNQKTGSTAIAALMAQAAGKSVTLDLVRAIPDACWQLGVKYNVESFESFVWQYRHEFRNTVIKEPSFTYFYDELREVFPNGQFVFIQRDPFQNIRSILNRLQIPGDLDDIRFDDWTELNRYRIWRLALDSRWLGCGGGSYIEALAHRWNEAAKILTENRDDFHFVKYEEFVKDKAGTISRLCASLQLSVKNDISPFVDTQYQSKGSSGVNIVDFFGASNYQAIDRICGERARSLGYVDHQLPRYGNNRATV